MSSPPRPLPPLITAPPPPAGNGSSTPTSSPPEPSSNSRLLALGIGIGIGGALVLVCVGIFFIWYKRRKRRLALAGSLLIPQQGPKDDPYGGPREHWQQNAPPPGVLNPPPPPSVSGSLHSVNSLTQPSSSKTSFTYHELACATDGFSNTNLLGEGGFGYVHKGVLPNGKEVAIKQLKAGSGQGEREFQAEVEFINRVHHRHLVSLVGYCISESQRLLVYEFVPNKTLEFHLHGEGQPPLNWATRMKIAVASAKGLAYLHEDCC